MLIKAGYDISYEVWAPTPMVLMLYIHPSRHGDIRKRDQLLVEPNIRWRSTSIASATAARASWRPRG